MSRAPCASIVIACQPRLPGAAGVLTARDAVNVRPPSADRATRIVVPSRLDTHETNTSGAGEPEQTALRIATRGGCSPDTRTSPSTSLTRAGGPNVRPPSALTAA